MDCGGCEHILPADVVGAMIRVRLKTCDGVPFDLTDATNVEFLFKPPTGASFSRPGIVDPPPTRGVVFYVSMSGDFTVPGTWRYQIKIELTGGRVLFTPLSAFTVYKNIQ